MSCCHRVLLGLMVLAGLAACSGNPVTLVPRRAETPVPKTTATPSPKASPTPSPSASPTPGSSATLSAAQVSTALQGAQSYFNSLPQTDINADLRALAAHMVSTKAFKSATVGYGGITATLPDGTRSLIVADTPESLGLVRANASAAAPAAATTRETRPRRADIGPATGHEIAFLYNDEPNPNPSIIPAFSPTESTAYATAFTNLGYTPQNGYNADAAVFGLDSLAALSAGHPLDLLQISTHGVVVVTSVSLLGNPTYDFALLTTTPLSSSLDTQYAADRAKGTLLASVRVAFSVFGGGAAGALSTNPTYSVTPAFLTSHLTFNPGAIVDFQSCYSANSAIASQVATTLNLANVGTYLGWTKAVAGVDSRQTDAFLLDRLLGEQSPSVTKLDQYVAQRTPPQRPFPLSDISTVEQTEMRSNPGGTGGGGGFPSTYAVSDVKDPENALAPPLGSTAAVLMVQTLPAASSIALPEIYDVPSISRLAEVAPLAAGGAGSLDIYGSFPSVQGTVTITDSSGAHSLAVQNWTQQQITVALPGSGAGSAGQVAVIDADNISSNLVPLTQWQGTLQYAETDSLDSVNGIDGGGMGTFDVSFNLTFRSDVHPTVPAIDTTPVPQNLFFPQAESTSSATVTALQGTFTSAEGTPPPDEATFSLSQVSPMQPGPLPLSRGTFIVGGYPGQPSPCNNGSAGPEGDGGYIFCPAFGYKPPAIGVCTPTPSDSAICGSATSFVPGGSFGAPGLIDPGIVAFTMDPATYAISVSNPPTDFPRDLAFGSWMASAQVTGTIGPPAYAPSATTTAAVRGRSVPRR